MANPEFKKLLQNLSHHAYLVVGDEAENYEGLRLAAREKLLNKEVEAADIWSRTYENLTIDEAREIKEVVLTKPNGEKRLVLISVSAIQSEAQNSLLKLFEEPSSQTVFFVCVRHQGVLLSTLLSRFNIVELKNSGESVDPQKTALKFLNSTVQERVTMLEPIIKEKDKSGAENFLNSLETALRDRKLYKNEVFEDIFSARRFLRSRSPSVKMILEHLAGSVPQTKNS